MWTQSVQQPGGQPHSVWGQATWAWPGLRSQPQQPWKRQARICSFSGQEGPRITGLWRFACPGEWGRGLGARSRGRFPPSCPEPRFLTGKSQAPTPTCLSGAQSRAGAAARDRDGDSDWQHPARPAEPLGRLYPQSCPEPGPPAPRQLWPCSCGSEADLRPHASRSRLAASTHPIPRGRAQGPPPECRPGPVTFQTRPAHHQPGPLLRIPPRACLDRGCSPNP